MKANIELPPKLVPVFTGKTRYRGAYGGRGSGKTASFALMTAVRGYQYAMQGVTGQILCGREFQSSLEESSFVEIKDAINRVDWLKDFYDVGEKYIRTKCGRIRYTFSGLRHNVDNIKSKGKILIAWVDEAESVSEVAWQKLMPTVREEDSEVWVTWNPESVDSATHLRFRQDAPDDSKIIELNHSDNPWFSETLNNERLEDLKKRPDTYNWIWEGAFNDNKDGAIFAKYLITAKEEERITFTPYKEGIPVITAWDLGKSDKTSIWFAQVVGFQVRVIDYYEANGEDLPHYAKLIRSKPYEYDKHYLPHDGKHERLGMDGSIKDQLQGMGLKCEALPVSGVAAGIETARTLLKTCFIDKDRCADGLKSLRNYRYAYDEKKKVFSKKPLHDWASDPSDAFRYLAIAVEDYSREDDEYDYYEEPDMGGGWMGA